MSQNFYDFFEEFFENEDILVEEAKKAWQTSSMKPILIPNGKPLTFADLCYLIYQAYGESITINFIEDVEEPGVSYVHCDTCVGESPIYEGSCLLCGGTV